MLYLRVNTALASSSESSSVETMETCVPELVLSPMETSVTEGIVFKAELTFPAQPPQVMPVISAR